MIPSFPILAGGGVAAPAAITDPFYANVVLLLHGEGADASTTFTDNGSGGKTVTPNGNAQIDTAQFKFGSASMLFDGTGDYLSVPDSADWDFGTGDFTIEMWARFATHTTVQSLVNNYQNSTNGFTLQRRSDTNALVFLHGDTTLLSAAWVPSDNTWYHVATARQGTTLQSFIDGASIGSTTNSTNITGSANPLLVGAANNGGIIQGMNGWFDEIRITKGVARYTGTFTPPAAAFPNS